MAVQINDYIRSRNYRLTVAQNASLSSQLNDAKSAVATAQKEAEAAQKQADAFQEAFELLAEKNGFNNQLSKIVVRVNLPDHYTNSNAPNAVQLLLGNKVLQPVTGSSDEKPADNVEILADLDWVDPNDTTDKPVCLRVSSVKQLIVQPVDNEGKQRGSSTAFKPSSFEVSIEAVASEPKEFGDCVECQQLNSDDVVSVGNIMVKNGRKTQKDAPSLGEPTKNAVVFEVELEEKSESSDIDAPTHCAKFTLCSASEPESLYECHPVPAEVSDTTEQ